MLYASEEVFTTGSLNILNFGNKQDIYFQDYCVTSTTINREIIICNNGEYLNLNPHPNPNFNYVTTFIPQNINTMISFSGTVIFDNKIESAIMNVVITDTNGNQSYINISQTVNSNIVDFSFPSQQKHYGNFTLFNGEAANVRFSLLPHYDISSIQQI